MKIRSISLLILQLLAVPVQAEEDSPVGIYSNNAQGFETVEVVLGRNGAGLLSGSAGGGIPLRKWHYDKAAQEITIEGPIGKEGQSKEYQFRYNPEDKTLSPLVHWKGGVLKKSERDESDEYLQRWDKVPNPEALKIAEQLSRSALLKGDGVCIVTMNTGASEVGDYLKDLGFALKVGDEVFAISNVVKPLHVTVQLRKEDGEWKVVKQHQMR